MANRITEFAATIRAKLKDVKDTTDLENDMVVVFDDHFQYQQIQAREHASGKLSSDEAQTIYMALGEVMSTKNGGWKNHVDLALKVAITQMIAELLAKRRGVKL